MNSLIIKRVINEANYMLDTKKESCNINVKIYRSNI